MKTSKQKLLEALQGVQKFAGGGTASAPSSNGAPGGIAAGTNQVANPTGGFNPAAKVYGLAAQPMQTGIQGAGGLVQGIGQAFTAQNQFQANLAPTDYNYYGGYIDQSANQALSGYANAQQIQAQQQDLANTLQAQSMGAGPNPAQMALAQNTGTNVANQAALMASQRGAGANVGLMARQAAQQGAATQQNAVGQAATMQAQQQLAAQQALQQQQALMASGNVAEQQANNQLFGSASGAQNTQNSNTIQNYNNANQINASVAAQNAAADNKTTGGLLGGASSLMGGMMADGGEVGGAQPAPMPMAMPSNGMSSLAQSLLKMKSGGMVPSPNMGSALKTGGAVPGKAKVAGNSTKNDTVKALLSPGEVVLDRETMADKGPVGQAARALKAIVEAKKKGKK